MADNGELTVKQQMFCKEYLIDLNATQAAIRAGYSPKTAKVQGCQNLTKLNIQNVIQKLKVERSKRLQLDADDVVRELVRVGYSNIQDYLTVDEDGEVHIKNFDDIDRDKLAAVESVKVNITKNKDETRTYSTTQFKLHPKLNALEQLMKHLGLFKADSIPVEQASEPLSDKERKRLKRALTIAEEEERQEERQEERRKAEYLQPPDTTKNALDTARATAELSAKVEGTPAWELEQNAQEIDANSEQTVGERRQAERLANLDKQKLTENEDEPKDR